MDPPFDRTFDWNALHAVCTNGVLFPFLQALPRARWRARNVAGWTLLHYAAIGDNPAAAAALLKHGLDVNARDGGGRSALFLAASNAQPRVAECLLAAGADMAPFTAVSYAPLDQALRGLALGHDDECVHVLVANGARLRASHKDFSSRITPELVAFERGVLRCRAAVVAMLRVKRASGNMVHWDRFLLKALAVCVWATRADKKWDA